MRATSYSNPKDLIKLAREKSQENRAALATAMSDLYSEKEHLLTAEDRRLMFEILRQLIKDMETSLRVTLAEHLAARSEAPPDLILTLANDDIAVAFPILSKSKVLKDPELIEIIQHRTMEHQLAIAMRPYISRDVSSALVATNNEKVVTTLLSNAGATISEYDISTLVKQSNKIGSYHKPLVHRRELSHELAKKLYWAVSAALREHIVANFNIDVNELDDNIEAATRQFVPLETSAPNQGAAPRFTADQIADEQHILIRLLRQGDVAMFFDKFVMLSGLRVMLARRILFESGGHGLGIVCRAIGLDKGTFASMLLLLRQGRVGDKRVNQDELSRAVAFYDQTTPEAAKAMLRRWRRSPDYLNALRLLEQADEN